MVNLEDVIRHSISKLEHVVKQDNCRVCRTIVQTLVKEVMEDRNNWRIVAEEGLIQSVVGIIKQFSVQGSERDIQMRLQLVGECLDILIALKSFVSLDHEDSVPICVLLRLHGVDTIVHSLIKHLKLTIRPTSVILQTLKLLYIVGCSEQGARMLAESRMSEILLDSIGTFSKNERNSQLGMIRILVTISLFNQIPPRVFQDKNGINRIQKVLECGQSTSDDDFGFHRELTCFLCMASTSRLGAIAILAHDSSLGYFANLLHLSTTEILKSTSTLKEDSFELEADSKPPLSPSSPSSEQYSAIDAYARNAVSAGSSMLTNLIRRQNPVSVEKETIETYNNKSLGDLKFAEAKRIATWVSMLLNNLCVYSKSDVQMRMVIAQAFEISNAALGTDFDIPLFQRVLHNSQWVCQDESEPTTPTDIEESCEKLVDYIVSGESLYDERGDATSLVVLLNLELLTIETDSRVHLENLLLVLLERFGNVVAGTEQGIEPILPLPKEGCKIVSFVFFLVAHPVLQRQLVQNPKAMKLIVGDENSFRSTLDRINIPEYLGGIKRYLQQLVQGGDIKVLPMLPYRSFPSSNVSTLRSFDSTVLVTLNLEAPTDAKLSPVKPRSASISGSPPVVVPKKKRRATAYMPSQSNVVLSPLLQGKTVFGSFESEHSFDEDNEAKNAFNLFEYCGQERHVAIQMSLRLERMYIVLDPSKVLLLGSSICVDKCIAETRFLEEYEKMVYFFKTQILNGDTPYVRARIVETIIGIASAAAGPLLRDASSTMACLEALECSAVRRLELTWRNVRDEKWQIFDELKKLCGLEDIVSKSSSPTKKGKKATSTQKKSDSELLLTNCTFGNFFSVARIPFVKGLVHSLKTMERIRRSHGRSSSTASPECIKRRMPSCEDVLDLAYGDDTTTTRSHSVSDFDPLGLFNNFHSSTSAENIDFDVLDQRYKILREWVPTIRGDGDWFQKMHTHAPDISLQIILKSIKALPVYDTTEELHDLSMRQEPPWSLDQMLLESLYAIEGWIEALFESDVEEEGKVIRAFRNRIGKQENETHASSRMAQGLEQAAAVFRVTATSTAEPGSNGFTSGQKPIPQFSAASTGKLIHSLVRKISVARRERLLVESGSRSAEHWDKIVSHVRLCVERIVLAPLLSRLLLAALREHTSSECALQERVLILKSLSHSNLVDILGLSTRGDLHLQSWSGPTATLQSIDIVDMPSLKLEILLRLKDQIFIESDRCGVQDMNADEFLPVMTFVIIQADLKHAYSTTMLLRELLSDEFVSGEAAYYLTTFEIALGHILSMPLPDDILSPKPKLSFST